MRCIGVWRLKKDRQSFDVYLFMMSVRSLWAFGLPSSLYLSTHYTPFSYCPTLRLIQAISLVSVGKPAVFHRTSITTL